MFQRHIEAVKVKLCGIETELNNIGRIPRKLPALLDQLNCMQVS